MEEDDNVKKGMIELRQYTLCHGSTRPKLIVRLLSNESELYHDLHFINAWTNNTSKLLNAHLLDYYTTNITSTVCLVYTDALNAF